MDSETLLSFIKERGFRTRTEILEKFSGEDTEIIDMHLKYFQDKNMAAKVSFDRNNQSEDLYYIPYLG